MVNYHAIGLWFTNQGGFSIHNPQEEASLKVSCFILDNPSKDMNLVSNTNSNINNTSAATTNNSTEVGEGIVTSSSESVIDYDAIDIHRAQAYPTLYYIFQETVNLFGPNDFFILQKSLKEDMPSPPLRTVLSMLKLSDWDPDIFFKFRDSILNNAPTCNFKLKNDLCRGIPRIWENHYMLDMEKDIAFEIGRFYYGIKNYEKALFYYGISIEQIGKHHVTYHNQGLCYYSLNQLDTALGFFQKAYDLDNNYEKARNWIEKVTREKMTRLMNTTTAFATVVDETDMSTPLTLGAGSSTSSSISPKAGSQNIVSGVMNQLVDSTIANNDNNNQIPSTTTINKGGFNLTHVNSSTTSLDSIGDLESDEDNDYEQEFVLKNTMTTTGITGIIDLENEGVFTINPTDPIVLPHK